MLVEYDCNEKINIPFSEFLKVKENNIDGIIFRNYLSRANIYTMLSFYNDIFKKLNTKAFQGYVTPRSYTQIRDDFHSMKLFEGDYFKKAKVFNQLLQINGVEILNSLDKLGTLFNISLSSLGTVNSDFEPPVFTFREILPNHKFGYHLHKHNHLHKFNPEFKSYYPEIDFSNELSLLIMLQNGGEGGKLNLHHDFGDSFYSKENDAIVDFNGNVIQKYSLDSIKHTVNLQAGDAILFEVGNQWHSVDEVIGEGDSRITCGYFMSYSNNIIYRYS